jgi:antitoxin ParD1/3/4
MQLAIACVFTRRIVRSANLQVPHGSCSARAKVATGEYATESEVLRDGLRTLLGGDRAVEAWLREEVAPAYDARKADPSRVVSVDDIRAPLSAEHAKATSTR